MKARKAISLLTVLALLAALMWLTPVASAAPAKQLMPPNEIKMLQALRNWGKIPAGATEDEAQAILAEYLSNLLGSRPTDYPNPLAARALAEREAKGWSAQGVHGRKLGQNVEVPNSTPVEYGEPAVDRILVLLVEFTDPEHNRIPQPAPDNNADYWVPDFNREHYQEMLFDRTPGAYTMANYYIEQSYGTYTVDGVAYGWAKVNFPESEYGADLVRPDGSTVIDAQNGPVWRVVRDVVDALGGSVPWADYDVEDPYDLDGDGEYAEADGYVDHLMVVHAGAGQEAGGGAQGTDAIWSHSWWVDYQAGVGPGYGGCPTSDPSVWVGPYTIMPEDGAIGVFCHEFAHDLGLPDEYDTIYSGEASTGFYTLMSSGSWLGQPLGTQPSDISVWGRYVLGWVAPVRLNLSSGDQEVLLDQVEHKGQFNEAIRFDLPKKDCVLDINVPHSGANEWWSGKGDLLNNTLTRAIDLTGLSSATLNIWAWYDIEEDWDYGYVEVSADGQSWMTLPSTITTNTNPNGNNDGNGITGRSGGWVNASFDLSPVAGGPAFLRFRYETDVAVSLPGFCVDDISIPEIGYFDDVEAGNVGWTPSGWTVFAGQLRYKANHYYMLEWRNYIGFDEALTHCYNFKYGDTVEWFPYTAGLLVWYRDMEYTDNWVGVHPGHGFLLIVDSHPAPMMRSKYGVPWRTRVQICDAAFGRDKTPDVTLTSYGKTKTYPGTAAVPEFNDSKTYWNPAKPDSSVITPTYGLSFNVIGVSPDRSAALIGVYPPK
ncbi:MAG: immune inhibitor A [Acetobacteraceae bacterium]|nr:immune inhibitor A [Acetobacteraceae bacterium]